MKKNLDLGVDLYTCLEDDAAPMTGAIYHGALNKIEDGLYSFIEAARTTRRESPRSKRVFTGDFITLSRRVDDTYTFSFRNRFPNVTRKEFARRVANEIKYAFTLIS